MPIGDVCIYAGEPRWREQEAKVSLTSKCEFAGCAFLVEELQRALGVSPGGNPGELQFGEYLRIAREKPQSPTAPPLYGFDADGISGTQPLIAGLEAINYGIPEEVLLPSSDRYPVLGTILTFLRAKGGEFRSVAELAEQMAPALNLSDKWNDPIVRRNENTWKEAKIEYEQYLPALKSRQGSILAVRDVKGLIRHLILMTVIDGKTVIVPLTFAQHPNYRQPRVCYFPFSPNWWLMGSEQLEKHPEAEVWITNSIDCGNSFNGERIFLRYFFGKEMIPHLELDCLFGRDVKCLIIKEQDVQETRRNVEEAILLMSRLKSMDIKAEFKIVDKSAPTYCGKPRHIRDMTIPNVIFCYRPNDVSIDQIVMLAMSYGIEIPENLRPDRYGALISENETNLVADFLDSGAVTAVTAHIGVDLTLVTCSIVAGLHNGEIFSGKWSCKQEIKPALFIKNNTKNRHKTFYKELSPDNLSCYEIPSGSREEIEHRLYHIVKEFGFNVFIFESRQIIHEYRKEIQTACEWAEKHGVEIVIITTQEDRSAESFFCDICGKDIHLWQTQKIKKEYIVEDRPLLEGDAAAFKITFTGHSWNVQDHAEEELRALMDRNVKILHEETENTNSISDPAINYRR